MAQRFFAHHLMKLLTAWHPSNASLIFSFFISGDFIYLTFFHEWEIITKSDCISGKITFWCWACIFPSYWSRHVYTLVTWLRYIVSTDIHVSLLCTYTSYSIILGNVILISFSSAPIFLLMNSLCKNIWY